MVVWNVKIMAVWNVKIMVVWNVKKTLSYLSYTM